MRLAASIVTYRTHPDELAGALRSLAANGVTRVYVVDNSRSHVTERQCKDYPSVVYIGADNNGYGAGHNIALRRSEADGTEYHLVMNPDILFDGRTLMPLVDYMDANADVGAVQPRMVGVDGKIQYTVRMLPTPVDLIGRRFLPGFVISKRNARYELRHIDHSKPFNAPYHQGSFMLLRVSALRMTGLFDERFFMYPEDIDLTRRIHAHFRTMYVPFVTVMHNHRKESYRSWRMTWIHCVNMVRYFNKWGWWHDPERTIVNVTLCNK